MTINRLLIPEENFELKDYFVAPPSTAENMEFQHVIVSFFSKIVIRDRRRDINANIIHSSEPNPGPGKSIFILDVDVFRAGDFSASEELLEILNSLRLVKNEIFFKQITEKTVELFK